MTPFQLSIVESLLLAWPDYFKLLPLIRFPSLTPCHRFTHTAQFCLN